MQDTRDPGSIPGLWRSPGKGSGNPLQYSCLESSMDRGAWRVQSMGPQRVEHDWVTEHTLFRLEAIWITAKEQFLSVSFPHFHLLKTFKPMYLLYLKNFYLSFKEQVRLFFSCWVYSNFLPCLFCSVTYFSVYIMSSVYYYLPFLLVVYIHFFWILRFSRAKILF